MADFYNEKYVAKFENLSPMIRAYRIVKRARQIKVFRDRVESEMNFAQKIRDYSIILYVQIDIRIINR